MLLVHIDAAVGVTCQTYPEVLRQPPDQVNAQLHEHIHLAEVESSLGQLPSDYQIVFVDIKIVPLFRKPSLRSLQQRGCIGRLFRNANVELQIVCRLCNSEHEVEDVRRRRADGQFAGVAGAEYQEEGLGVDVAKGDLEVPQVIVGARDVVDAPPAEEALVQ